MNKIASNRVWLTAGIIGLPLGVLSLLLLFAIERLTHLLWNDVPESLGMHDDPSWWFVILVPCVGGLLAALLLGRMASPPEASLSLVPQPLRELVWLLAGALATLSFGFVIGPEGPLLAMAIALSAFAAGRAGLVDMAERTTIIIAGAFAVLATLLGSPIVALVLLLEMLAKSGNVPAQRLIPTLLPGLLSGALGLLVFAGVGGWSGIDPPTFAIPDLPAYDSVRLVDIAWCVPVAGATTAIILLIQRFASVAHPLMLRAPIRLTAALGAVTGIAAVLYRMQTDRPIGDVLFSGQLALPQYTAIGSAGVLLAILLFKGVAYAFALAARIEGGPIFPAIALGAAAGLAASLLLPGAAVVPMVAVAVAASAAAVDRLPVFGIVFSVLVLGSDNALVATLFSIIGALVGSALGTILEQRRARVVTPAA